MTIVLLAWLLSSVNWQLFFSLLSQLRWGFIISSFAAFLMSHLINVVRWHYLLEHPTPIYSKLFIYYGAGLFSNSFLPSGIGGDAIRAALLSREVPPTQAILSVALDRLIGMVALSALFVLGLYLGLPLGLELDTNRFVMKQSVIIILCLLIGLALLALYKVKPKFISRFFAFFQSKLNFSAIRERTFKSWLRLFGGGYLLSIFAHLGIVYAHLGIIYAINIDVSSGSAVWLVLASALALLVPITVNGLGLQENIYVVLLAQYGVSTTAALGVALLIRILMTIFSLLGGLLYLAGNIPPKAELDK